MITEKTKQALIDIVGFERYLDKAEDCISYSYDAFVEESVPHAVLLPGCTEDISRILAVANQEGIPVTARGSGTSLCGAPIPVQKGLVLSFTRMNQILEINTRDRYAIVQPGVINGHLQRELAKEGFFYPPDPASFQVSSIGGNIAQNAGGPRCLKYGVTGDYILALEVVLASGKVLRVGSRNVKDVTGYNLKSLFCGSEGTLGIVSEATLRVSPLPEAYRTILAVYNDLEECANTVADIIGSGIVPTALELMDSQTVNALEDSADYGLPRAAQGVLIIEVDGTEEGVEKEMKAIEEKARAQGAVEVKKARTQAERDDLWKARRSCYGVFARLAPNCIVEDATVPVSQIPGMIRGMKAIFEKYELKACILAHAGDGNMHPVITTDLNDPQQFERVEKATREVFDLAISLGGTLSGEHGIGLGKVPYLDMMINQDAQAIMGSIKQSFDPKGILNPGKFV